MSSWRRGPDHKLLRMGIEWLRFERPVGWRLFVEPHEFGNGECQLAYSSEPRDSYRFLVPRGGADTVRHGVAATAGPRSRAVSIAAAREETPTGWVDCLRRT